MTPLGTTDPEPIYKFATRTRDPVVSFSASNMVLTTNRYKSFSDFFSHMAFLFEKVVPRLDTTFFTRIGLRYINHIFWDNQERAVVQDWINEELIRPMVGTAIGELDTLKSELTGSLPEQGSFTLRYAFPNPSNESPDFVLDWDYYAEDIEVAQCENVLQSFHEIHFPFFWWSLGDRAKEALNKGDVRNR